MSDAPLGAIPGFRDDGVATGWTEVIDGRGIYVRRRPGNDAAHPVWFIHGITGASTNWNRLSAALAPYACGYSVDLPGHGHSDPPPLGDYSLPRQARFVARTIERVSGARVDLVANSYGGIIATLIAAHRPDLVRTLALVSPAVPDLRLTSDRGADPRLGLLLMPGVDGVAQRRLAGISASDRARGLGRLCFGRPESLSDQDYAAAAEEIGWRSGLPWAHSATTGAARALITSYLRPGRARFNALARRVTVPVLVVWGTRDRLVDVRLALPTVKGFRDGRLLVLAGCGHVAHMEDPESTARGILALWAAASGDRGSSRSDLAAVPADVDSHPGVSPVGLPDAVALSGP